MKKKPLIASVIIALTAYSLLLSLSEVEKKALPLVALTLTLWVTEAIPLAATSLLIAVAQPLSKALTPFFQSYNRSVPRRVVAGGSNLGLMLATAFLSMWISNTAAAVMIALALEAVDLNDENAFKSNNTRSGLRSNSRRDSNANRNAAKRNSL